MGRAIFFDLDNTLVHRNKSIELYAERFLDEYSGLLPCIEVKEIATVICEHDNGGYPRRNSSYKSVKDAVSHELHKSFLTQSSVKPEDIRSHWINVFPECTIPMSGANDLINYLSENDYHVGIISNGTDKSRKSTAQKLTSFPLIKQLVSSELAGVRKPGTEIFISTVRDAGFTPDQCWYIGDHPINDIQGARKAGMQTIWLSGFHEWPQGLELPAHSIEALAEAKAVLVPNSGSCSLNDTKASVRLKR